MMIGVAHLERHSQGMLDTALEGLTLPEVAGFNNAPKAMQKMVLDIGVENLSPKSRKLLEEYNSGNAR